MYGGAYPLDFSDARSAPGRRLRILVAGVDGVVGSNLADWLARRATVIGLHRDRPGTLPECQARLWDPSRPGTIARTVREAGPQWILYCGPFSRGLWDAPEAVPPAGEEAAVCKALVQAARRVEARLTVVSTDAVFTGPRMFHDEQSPPASQHAFGRGAIEVERAVEGSETLVVRTHAYGPSPRDEESCFAEKAWLAVAEGLPCDADAQRHATPIFTADLAELLWVAFQRGLGGVCHLAGAERASPARFAAEMASLAGLTRSAPTMPPAPPSGPINGGLWETSLDTRRARRELNRPMPMLRDGIARFIDQVRARAGRVACRHSA